MSVHNNVYRVRNPLIDMDPSPVKAADHGQTSLTASAAPLVLQDPTYLRQKPMLFNSGSADTSDSCYMFSNLFACRVELDGRVYPSAEHAYQGYKFGTECTHFAEGGRLSGFNAMCNFYKLEAPKEKNTAAGKVKFWKKKKMVGIIAKLAQGNPKKAGLGQVRRMDMATKRALFMRILLSKYRSNPQLKARLLETGDRYLLEFCRGARVREQKGKEPERWGGLAELRESGQWYLYGDNVMGELMMETRTALRNKN